MITILPENADFDETAARRDGDGKDAVLVDMEAVLAYRERNAALQILTTNLGDSCHDGPLPKHRGRKIVPTSPGSRK